MMTRKNNALYRIVEGLVKSGIFGFHLRIWRKKKVADIESPLPRTIRSATHIPVIEFRRAR